MLFVNNGKEAMKALNHHVHAASLQHGYWWLLMLNHVSIRNFLEC